MILFFRDLLFNLKEQQKEIFCHLFIPQKSVAAGDGHSSQNYIPDSHMGGRALALGTSPTAFLGTYLRS